MLYVCAFYKIRSNSRRHMLEQHKIRFKSHFKSTVFELKYNSKGYLIYTINAISNVFRVKLNAQNYHFLTTQILVYTDAAVTWHWLEGNIGSYFYVKITSTLNAIKRRLKNILTQSWINIMWYIGCFNINKRNTMNAY